MVLLLLFTCVGRMVILTLRFARHKSQGRENFTVTLRGVHAMDTVALAYPHPMSNCN